MKNNSTRYKNNQKTESRSRKKRIGGTGYLNGLQRENIPIAAKIVAVADVYDAIATDRPYRKACDEIEIRKILTELRGSALDEQLVDLFITKIMP